MESHSSSLKFSPTFHSPVYSGIQELVLLDPIHVYANNQIQCSVECSWGSTIYGRYKCLTAWFSKYDTKEAWALLLQHWVWPLPGKVGLHRISDPPKSSSRWQRRCDTIMWSKTIGSSLKWCSVFHHRYNYVDNFWKKRKELLSFKWGEV